MFIVPQRLKLPRTQFNVLVKDQVAHITKTLASKGEEYAPGQDDAMHNFNVAMAIEQTLQKREVSREDVIWGMAKKHFVSIMDMVADCRLDPNKITIEAVNEKFGDLINYFILMKASMLHTMQLHNDQQQFPKENLTGFKWDVTALSLLEAALKCGALKVLNISTAKLDTGDTFSMYMEQSATGRNLTNTHITYLTRKGEVVLTPVTNSASDGKYYIGFIEELQYAGFHMVYPGIAPSWVKNFEDKTKN